MCDPGIVLTESHLSGLRLAEVEYETEVRIPEHTHDETHFCLALQGRCVEVCQGRTFDHKRYTVGFLPAGFSHAVIYGKGAFRWLRMTVSPAWAERFDAYLERPLKPSHYTAGKLNDLFLRVCLEYRSPDVMSPLVIEALVCEMFAEVVRYETRVGREPPGWLLQARDYLDANFLKQITLTAVAEAVEAHPVHLAREFRRYFNCTIGDFIRKKRIGFVCGRLTDSDDPLVEIALAAGFCDQSHLSRVFKNSTGLTPARYRAIRNHPKLNR